MARFVVLASMCMVVGIAGCPVLRWASGLPTVEPVDSSLRAEGVSSGGDGGAAGEVGASSATAAEGASSGGPEADAGIGGGGGGTGGAGGEDGGDGGDPTPCEKGCARFAFCVGLDPCSTRQWICASDCEGTCVASTPCPQLGVSTLLDCSAACQAADGGTP